MDSPFVDGLINPDEQSGINNCQHQKADPEIGMARFVAEHHHAEIRADAASENGRGPQILFRNSSAVLPCLLLVYVHHKKRQNGYRSKITENDRKHINTSIKKDWRVFASLFYLSSCNGQTLGVISQLGCAANSAASPVRLMPVGPGRPFPLFLFVHCVFSLISQCCESSCIRYSDFS